MTAQSKNWNGPQSTPSYIGIDTPFKYLNDSWDIAVRLLDEGRMLYRQGKGLDRVPDNPDGFPGAWLPVSFGKRQPLVHTWDERDIRHLAKMVAYLWADEPGLIEEVERNFFIEEIRDNGDYRRYEGNSHNSSYANPVVMYASAASDMIWSFGLAKLERESVLGNMVKFVKRILEKFDPKGSGLLNVGVGPQWHSRCFWGTLLGEPNHLSANFDGRNKVVPATMSLAVFVKRLRDLTIDLDAKEAKELDSIYDRLVNAIEESTWNDAADYYYIQRDDNSDRWFHSINGLCEESRETDQVPHYAAEACKIPERVKAVGRVVSEAILKHRAFPMPTRYPTYAWYSPSNPNGVDMGDDCGQIGGAWDTPYFNCVQILERLGLQEAIQRAVLRRAEVIYRDQDCLESYRLDGTVDHARFYNRDRYVVSATAHLSSIIEGLFGVTPAKGSFAEVNIRPNLPLYRRHRHTSHPSEWSGRDNKINITLGEGRKVNMVIRYDEDTEILRLKTNNVGIVAHIRLPLDLGSRFKRASWNGEDLQSRLEKGMDSDFIHVDHVLDGGELKVELSPHPQKGKGGTPCVDPREA